MVRFDGAEPGGGTILSGVAPGEALPWRWTRRRAEFRFWPVADSSGTLEAIFSIVDVTLRQTGPVVVTFDAGGHRLASHHYERAGDYSLSVPLAVDEGQFDKPINVSLTVEPPWISPSDGVDRGLILKSIGLRFDHRNAALAQH